jgi:hypothetical protein
MGHGWSPDKSKKQGPIEKARILIRIRATEKQMESGGYKLAQMIK